MKFSLNFFANLVHPVQNVKDLLKRLLKIYGIFAIFNVAYKLYKTFYINYRFKTLWKHLPGPPHDTFAQDLAKNAHRFPEYYADQVLQHPTADLVRSSLPIPEIVCNTPKSIKWMLKDEFENITKPTPGQDFVIHLLGEFIGFDGIFVLRHNDLTNSGTKSSGDKKLNEENDKWFQERKISSRIFTKGNFSGFMYDVFLSKGDNVIKVLNEVAESGDKIDMQEIFFSFTMDSIERLFFGNDINTIQGGMSEYAKAFDTAHKSLLRFMMNNVPALLAIRLLLPYPFGKLGLDSDESRTIVMRIVRHFSKDNEQFTSSIAKLDKHVFSYITKTRSDKNIGQRKDIVANFLNSPFGETLTDKMLRDIILNLTIAGRDTTACALTWMFFELSQNLDCQEKLYEELKDKLNGRIPRLEDLEPDNLPYLNGCLYEALRLHPPVPTDSKVAQKDLVYLDGTVLPKGTKLAFLPFAVGRNPVLFSEPLTFSPTRWIPFSEKQKTLYEFPIFQAGPRFCLGKDMAQFEAKLLSAMLLQKFKFTLVPGEEKKIWYNMMLTMSLSNSPTRDTSNLWMKVSKR